MSEKHTQSILQKPQQRLDAPQSRLIGNADVVFVLDRSGSMSPIFRRVRDWIAEFVAGVTSADTAAVNVRYGLLCYTAVEFHRLREYFTTSSARFGDAIRQLGTSNYDETTLPAIDAACDFPWNDNGHRFLIVLTDEATDTGHDPDWQRSRVEQLKEKLIRLRVKLWLAAPECPTYRQFEDVPHFDYRLVAGHDFEQPAWLSSFMRLLGKKVSILSQTSTPSAQNVQPDLYALASAGIRIRCI